MCVVGLGFQMPCTVHVYIMWLGVGVKSVACCSLMFGSDLILVCCQVVYGVLAVTLFCVLQASNVMHYAGDNVRFEKCLSVCLSEFGIWRFAVLQASLHLAASDELECCLLLLLRAE